MHRSGLILLAALAACGGPTSRGPATSGVAQPEPVAWNADSHADSIGAWVVRQCGRVIGRDRKCAERALYSVIEPAGVGKAMAALEVVLARIPALAPDAHGLAHGMGIAAYRSPQTVGHTFASCPPTQMAGCYHGVIQGYFLALTRDAGAVSPAVLNSVCDEHRANPSLFFQCAHGLGHGVMALERHHLPRALARCDELRDQFVRENCYGGVFMENIVATAHPQHTAESHSAVAGTQDAGAHAGHGDHAGHAPAPDTAGGAWTPLKRDDLLYPCTAVGAKYWNQCYQMQSSGALVLASGNLGAVAAACGRAPAAYVHTCFASLGRDVSALARMNPARSVQLCQEAGAAGMPACIAGVARVFVNQRSKPAEGLAFCREVPAAAKPACYRAVGAMSRTVATQAEREALCATVEPGHVASCRESAGLPRAPTPPAAG